MVEALDELCGRGGEGMGGEGTARDTIVKTTSAQAFGFDLLGFALASAEVCQKVKYGNRVRVS